MLTLKEWMEIVNYRITEGADFCWDCYGPNAYSLDSWNGDQDGHSLSIYFDTRTQEVYEVQAHDYRNQRAYRLINPEFVEKHKEEANSRKIEMKEAWEDVNYVDLDVVDDFIQKALAIEAGDDYDTRVSMPVDFTDDELLKYMKMAHERDMTFNQFVEEALRQALDDYNSDPEGMKARADRWKVEHDIT